ncbi:MAG: family 43 glycosylhydrolase [Oscillospiraceae bacterium]|nr:family 43 glycosylhydrolase [Oscillospiraceae bacterium]
MLVLRKAAVILCAALILQTAAVPVTPAAAETSGSIRSIYADENENVLSAAVYTIRPRLSGKFLTAAEDRNVHQWESLDSKTQQWQIISTGDGFCRILSETDHSLALTVENGNSDNGNNIYLSQYTDSSSQHFKLHRTDDAYYITAQCSGNTALDVYDISYDNGANIDQWDYWGGEGQKFYIDPADDRYTLTHGDINGDGNVDISDLVLMRAGCLYGYDEYTSAVADMNEDDINNSDDIHIMNSILSGMDTGSDPQQCSITHKKQNTAYLFAYFGGNDPSQERLSYAVSLDGYHFNALNNGSPVFSSDTGTKCLRDPYIFKGEDGFYYLLATDMKSSLGWSSNRNLISAKSTDLVHWFDETLIEIADKYPSMMGSDRAWAPQAIYDPAKKSYMIYWANHSYETGNATVMYYAYSRDLKNLDTSPALLFAPKNGDSAIDADIIFRNNKYYMYYKNETNKRIYLAQSENASGPFCEIKQISEGNIGVEGPNIYNITGTDKWLMMSDAYANGYYVMQETADLENFSTIPRSSYSFDFTPRHGYVIPINDDQYDALTSAFPSDSLSPRNTGLAPVRMTVSLNTQPDMPETVAARYSNAMTADFPVIWNQSELDAVNTSVPGVYKITGTVQTDMYNDPFIKERADPYIVKDTDSGYYYFTASYPAYGSADQGYDRIILRRSDTVSGLADAQEKTIWKAHSDGKMAKHIWAPEMHCIKGIWYIFFAAGDSDNVWNIRPYVLRCSGDPYTGSWTECGQMQASNGDTSSFANFSLDITYFEHNGKHYVIWAEIKGDSSLFMAQIDPDEPNKLICAPIMLTKPEYDWEKVNNRVNEGACVLKTDSRIYVYFSASGTGSEYCVGRLEADADSDLMNPVSWKKLSKPVLTSADVYDQAGPGHNSFVTDENGDLLLVYHARPSSHSYKECGTYSSDPLYDPCRHTHIKRVYFSPDGEPAISMNREEEFSSRFQSVTAVITVR